MSNSDATVYYALPTETTNTTYTDQPRGRRGDSGYFAIVILCVALALAFIIFGTLEYKKVNSFSVEAGYCHVKGVYTERVIRKQLSRVNLVWYVDIVKEPQQGKNLSVLHTNLKITAGEGYVFADAALEDAKSRYKVCLLSSLVSIHRSISCCCCLQVGKIYPCYIRKRLLSGDADGSSIRDPVQRKVPSKTSAVTLLTCGAVLEITGIIFLFIAIIRSR
jgi:hypothetical protein